MQLDESTRAKPVFTMVTSVTEPSASTAIYRRFRPGDAVRCRLCDQCTTNRDDCLIVVPGSFNILEVEGLEAIKVPGGWRVKPEADEEPAEVTEVQPRLSPLDWFREVMGT